MKNKLTPEQIVDKLDTTALPLKAWVSLVEKLLKKERRP